MNLKYFGDINQDEFLKCIGVVQMNIGDLMFQFIMFFILIGIIFAIYHFVRLIIKSSRTTDFKNIEQKLDKIIELLKKEKNE